MTVAVTPNWKPLEARLAPRLCAEFMWMFREGNVEHYKHTVTRHYLRLDGSARCVVLTPNGWKEVAFVAEWKRISGRA